MIEPVAKGDVIGDQRTARRRTPRTAAKKTITAKKVKSAKADQPPLTSKRAATRKTSTPAEAGKPRISKGTRSKRVTSVRRTPDSMTTPKPKANLEKAVVAKIVRQACC
jgi:hypothetical protein